MRIAFGYKKRSGKDTVVDYLCEHTFINEDNLHLKFSDPLYKILHDSQSLLGLPVKKDRKFLQFVGSEWARKKDPNVFVNYALNRINRINETDKNTNILISDLRFRNEAEMLKKNGFILIKINRKHKNVDNHISENELNDYVGWDYIIDNNKSLNHLYMYIDKIINRIYINL